LLNHQSMQTAHSFQTLILFLLLSFVYVVFINNKKKFFLF
jgi:hypothetical protein